MKYSYTDDNGIEYTIEDANDEKSNNNYSYEYTVNNKTKKNSGGCSGCLIKAISFILAVTGIIAIIKETSKDHIHEYCNLDKYIGSHQTDQMQSELENKTYYVYERQIIDVVSATDFESLKNSIDKDATIEFIKGPTTIKIETKKNKLPKGYDYVEDGYAYKVLNEDQYKITTKVRIISDKKKVKDFEQIGEYHFSNGDQIFIFAKSFNLDNKAQNVKMVKLDEFDKYLQDGYMFIGVADFEAFDKTLYKSYYSSILDIENYNFSDSEFVEDDLTEDYSITIK